MTFAGKGSYEQGLNNTVAMLKAGEARLALTQIDELLRHRPNEVNALYLKGVAKKNLAEPLEARAILNKVIRKSPEFAPAYQELGFVLHALNEVEDAINALRKAVAIDRTMAGSWQLLGQLLSIEGSEQEAEAAFREQLRVDNKHPLVIKAIEWVQQGRYGMAEGVCREYLMRHPTDVTVIRLMAEIGIKLGFIRDAELLLERCLELAPDFHLARNNYANVLSRTQKHAQAFQEIRRLRDVDPSNLAHPVLEAAMQVRVGDFDSAIQNYAEILRRVPKHASLQMSYGHALKTVGRQPDSIAAYRKAIEIRPHYGEAYWSLANLKTFSFTDEDITRMKEIEASTDCDPRDYFHVCFSLGKAHEDAGEYDASFKYYESGNQVKKEQERYDADETERNKEAMIGTCGRDLFEEKQGFGHDGPDPIFIVGLPRSGSTLVEQILASHSLVDGTSELPDIIAISRRLGGRTKADEVSKYPQILSDLDATQCAELGGGYLESTRIQRQGAPFFIDKMPNNFLHVGLISLILPNAKIIDARRHPMATCFSCYKQLFASGQTFTYGLRDIGRYFCDYVELMDHWEKVLPGKVLQVDYEKVIEDTEAQVRRMLDYCGLPFEEACLHFHETERAIRTASSEQVRQPIYTDAIDQWRNFEHHLDPLVEVLGSTLHRYT